LKIYVCVKQVPDTETKVKVAEDGKSLDERDLTLILNPYCEFAVEEGLRIKEKLGGDVTLVTVGPDGAKAALRSGLAMGADSAIHLSADNARMADSFVIASLLAEQIKAGAPDLVLMGKKSVDTDMQAVPPMTAALLNLPIVTAVVEAEWNIDSAKLVREIEGGKERYEMAYPLIATIDKGLNEPRYASLKGIMQAKKKPIETKTVNLSGETLVIEKMSYPPVAQPGKIVGEGAAVAPELIRLLREEAKVIE